MNAHTRTQLQAILTERRPGIVDRWYRALATTSFSPLEPAQVRQRLDELAGQIIALLLAEPFAAGPAESVGLALVELRFVQPEAAGATHDVLGQLVVGLSTRQTALLQPRLVEIVGVIMTSLFRAAKATILDEQEQVRDALVSELRAVEVALRRATVELDQRVQERTAELRRSEANFRALADNANDGILVATADGGYVYANERAAHLLGYRVSDLLQLHMRDLVDPAEADRVQSIFIQRLAGLPAPNQYETVLLHQNGTLVPVELTAARTTWRNQPTVMVILRDISARQAAQAAIQQRNRELAKEKQKTETILYSIVDGVCVTDLERRITTLNPAAARLLGQADQEVVGQSCTQVLQCHDHQGQSLCGLGCPMHTVRDEQRYKYSRLGRLFLRTASGRSLPVLSMTGPLTDPDDQTVGHVLTFRDATYELEMERLQSEFTAMISHEVRTPLTNLKAAAQTITRYQAGQDEKTRTLLARIIENQCNQLDYLVKRIQQMGWLESGHLDIQVEALPIGPLVRSIVQGFEMREHPIDIAAGDDELWVLGHDDSINMVLNNLIENAAKYSRPTGAITIQVKPWRDNLVLVAVLDEGPAIPAHLRSRIFERYYRVDNSDTRSVYGLGLGLPIALELVTGMGGQLWVDGQESNGQPGNRFCFTLLRTEAPV